MKNITKDNKGITLIALIMTVIIMLILASVTAYTGINAYKNSKVNHFVNQMQLLQAKIDDLVSTLNAEELNSLNLKSITSQEEQNAINYAFENGEVTTNNVYAYKVFTVDNIIDILDVEDIQDAIMVNFETREIVSISGIEYEGKTYYTQYMLPNGQTIINNSSKDRDLTFETKSSVDGLNTIISINNISISNGTLSFAEADLEGNASNWKTITNCTEKNQKYTTNISKAGYYVFKLQDNTNIDNSIEKRIKITLTNKPKTNLDLQSYNYGENSDLWAYAQDIDGLNYVWIPRFAYRTNSDTNNAEIKFIKGNSNIATDNTYIDKEWTVNQKFISENGTELTGIWVSVDSMNQKDLNMIELLNNSNGKILTEINTQS